MRYNYGVQLKAWNVRNVMKCVQNKGASFLKIVYKLLFKYFRYNVGNKICLVAGVIQMP